MQNPGSAGGNTAADHAAVLDAAIAALPPRFRQQLMVTLRRGRSQSRPDGPQASARFQLAGNGVGRLPGRPGHAYARSLERDGTARRTPGFHATPGGSDV